MRLLKPSAKIGDYLGQPSPFQASSTMGAHAVSANGFAMLPAWAVMWLIAFAIFISCKLLTWTAATTKGVPHWRQVAYLLAWPGLNASRFLSRKPLPENQRPLGSEWIDAAFRMTAGALIFWNAHRLIGSDSQIVLAWAGMIGTIFMLHFGIFHLLSCAWRSVGIDAHPLMNHPMRSTSITEFWSCRWNSAFRDFTHQFVFRPLTRRLGVKSALIIGFLYSGLIHDLVVSVPAGGGYGGPTLFFTIQGLAIVLEKSRAGRTLGLGEGLRGWLFTALVLLVPVPLLFHLPFLKEIVIPFMGALGAAGPYRGLSL